jgi:hypothetical protein
MTQALLLQNLESFKYLFNNNPNCIFINKFICLLVQRDIGLKTILQFQAFGKNSKIIINDLQNLFVILVIDHLEVFDLERIDRLV